MPAPPLPTKWLHPLPKTIFPTPPSPKSATVSQPQGDKATIGPASFGNLSLQTTRRNENRHHRWYRISRFHWFISFHLFLFTFFMALHSPWDSRQIAQCDTAQSKSMKHPTKNATERGEQKPRNEAKQRELRTCCVQEKREGITEVEAASLEQGDISNKRWDGLHTILFPFQTHPSHTEFPRIQPVNPRTNALG